MPLFKVFRKKEKAADAAPTAGATPATNQKNSLNGSNSNSGGKPPLNAKNAGGFLGRSSNNSNMKQGGGGGGGGGIAGSLKALGNKHKNRNSNSSSNNNNAVNSINNSSSHKKEETKDTLSQNLPPMPPNRKKPQASEVLSSDRSASSRSAASSSVHSPSHPTTANSSRQNSDDDDSSNHSGVSHGSTSASSNFKKASLRRSGSVGGASNPKSLTHSTSAIGLDEMIEDRREVGTLGQNVVHIEVPFGKPIEEVYDGVHNGPVLGSGISGMVRLVTHKATGLKYAVKVLDLGLVETPTGLQQLREEIFIMCQLDHPNIVRLEEVYESRTEIYLVQELCLGGELFDRLDEQPEYHYTEAECARLVKQMLSAVRYLHSKGIIHRDLKLENFLFSSVHPDSELKMIDFGLSKHFRYGEVHHEAVGTPYTVAPEVIRGEYDERCDIWAIGVITFLLLSGEPPFGGCGGPEPMMTVRSNILQGHYQFEPAEVWEIVSPQALKFIQSLLVTDPSKRPTAKDAQKHQWFQEWAKRKPQNNQDRVLNPNVVKALVNFKEFSDMRKLLCEVLSFTLLPDQIRDLRREFEKMDTDGSGEISLAALKQVLMQNAGAGSLGALTEEEVTDIFDAMRVRKTETRIHWHEFIAAGLSQCSVDDRNLRLAFERLDSDHKGYITLDDIMDLMGSDALQSEEAMRRMWGDSIKAVKCQHARITYDDFLLLMKGQSRENPPDVRPHPPHPEAIAMLGSPLQNLKAVPESEALSTSSKDDEETPTAIPKTATIIPPEQHFLPKTAGFGGSMSAPATPADHKKIINLDRDDDELDSPLSMDDELPVPASLTPPITPERGANDYLSPRNNSQTKFTLPSPSGRENQGEMLLMPSLSSEEPLIRGRSRSLGQEKDGTHDEDSEDEDEIGVTRISSELSEDASGDLNVMADTVRDLMLPEHEHNIQVPTELEQVVKDQSKSALVVNRRLYRAHRQMRLAVLEASKRFEEQQAQHAKEVILAQRESEENESPAVYHAGLVMRHGHTKQVSSEAIRSMLARDRAEQQTLVEKASITSGRGRGRRKKTISDMSGMLRDVGSEEFNLSTGGSNSPNNSKRNSLDNQNTTPNMALESIELPIADDGPAPRAVREKLSSGSEPIPPKIAIAPVPLAAQGGLVALAGEPLAKGEAREGTIRSATVPGEFRKTTDPFGSRGKYGRPNWQQYGS